MKDPQLIPAEDVAAIQAAEKCVSDRELAARYGVSEFCVWRIRGGHATGRRPYAKPPMLAAVSNKTTSVVHPQVSISYTKTHIELRIPRMEFLRALLSTISGAPS